MSTASWHVEGSRLAAYARGDVDDAEAFSVEAHIVGCASCQAAGDDGHRPGAARGQLARGRSTRWTRLAAGVRRRPADPARRRAARRAAARRHAVAHRLLARRGRDRAGGRGRRGPPGRARPRAVPVHRRAGAGRRGRGGVRARARPDARAEPRRADVERAPAAAAHRRGGRRDARADRDRRARASRPGLDRRGLAAARARPDAREPRRSPTYVAHTTAFATVSGVWLAATMASAARPDDARRLFDGLGAARVRWR